MSTSMSALAEIVRNIRRIQDSGPHHYGDPTRGNPLTRTTSATIERANRGRVCPASRQRPAGMSCDEYSFARGNQGASRVPRKDRVRAWVPAGEQHRQGELLSSFHSANRDLNDDAYWVQVP
ncbi:NucA/NucB deoxyribonuclease domain-containing protein [Streptomyces sp. cg28]|uniref:NucA/NucB deoxyribonuclease domain-containing protein n=1 Tax=Streptomyces sp. cg28 TaxID=3403457 RepID=UPI003B217884